MMLKMLQIEMLAITYLDVCAFIESGNSKIKALWV